MPECVALLQCCSSQTAFPIPEKYFYIYIYIYIYINIEVFSGKVRASRELQQLQHCNKSLKTQKCDSL